MSATITAVEMARREGIEPTQFRAALRAAALPWHRHGERWIVERGSPEHRQMEAVLLALARR